MDIVWEEFVCDVMSGKSDYVSDHIDMVTDYWYGNEKVDNYKVAEYAESIDAGGVDNGNDKRGSLSEKPEQCGEAQETGKQSEEVQDRLSGNDDSGRSNLDLYKRGYSDTSRRIEQVETRALDKIYSDEKFNAFKDIANDSIPIELFIHLLREIYVEDVRLTEEGYDFEDVFAYDLISGKEKEISALFYDEISEYFNQSNSAEVDSTGKSVPQNILERLKRSTVKNAKGQLVHTYHSTTQKFDKFEIGDLGFHFGSYYSLM